MGNAVKSRRSRSAKVLPSGGEITSEMNTENQNRKNRQTKTFRARMITHVSEMHHDMFLISIDTWRDIHENLRCNAKRAFLPCFQTLKKQGKLVSINEVPPNSIVTYVSMERGGYKRSDPKAVRFKTLTRVLERLEKGDIGQVDMNAFHTLIYKEKYKKTAEEWRHIIPRMHIWFEWFSMPQPTMEDGDTVEALASRRELVSMREDALRSTPAYVEKSDMLIILAPGCIHQDHIDPHTRRKQNLSYRTFRSNGQCVLDLFSSFLSRTKRHPALVVRSAEAVPEFISSLEAQKLCVGRSFFSCCDWNHVDKDGRSIPCAKKLAARVLQRLIDKKMSSLFSDEKTTLARLMACNAHWFLRGLPIHDAANSVCDGTTKEDHGNEDDERALDMFKRRLRWVESSNDDSARVESMVWFDEENVPLLTYASFANELPVVRALLRHIAEIHDKSEQLSIMNAQIRKEGYVDLGILGHCTALHAAMFMACPEIVAALLDAGADPFSADQIGNVPFHYAAIGSQVKNIDYWLERFPEWDLELPNTVVGGIALGVAVYVGPKKYDTVKRLLDAGASVETLTHSGGSILTAACSNPDADPAVIRLVLERLRLVRENKSVHDITGGIDFRSYTGKRAQSWKWYFICTLTKTLHRCRAIKSGLLMHLATEAGMTALHFAVIYGDIDTIQPLLEYGADLSIRTDLGKTPQDLCHSFPDLEDALTKHQRKMKWARHFSSTVRTVSSTSSSSSISNVASSTTLRNVNLTRRITTASPCLYPMHLISAKLFLKIYGQANMQGTLKAHQRHLEREDLITSDDLTLGSHIIFVSHEWLSYNHPDPKRTKTDVLCRILQRFIDGDIDRIDMDPFQSLYYNCNYSMTASEIQKMMSKTYLWIDWLSMPQTAALPATATEETKARVGAMGWNAIRSIPAYIERSDFVLILAPCGQHADRKDPKTKKGVYTSYRTWRSRGWCLVEFMASFLSRDSSAPMMLVKSAEGTPMWISPLEAQKLAVGLADFTCCQRNHKITTMTQKIASEAGAADAKSDNGGEDVSSSTSDSNEVEVTTKTIGCDKFVVVKILQTLIRKKIAHLFENTKQMTLARLYQCNAHWFLRGLPMKEALNDVCDDGSTKEEHENDDGDRALEMFKQRLRWKDTTKNDSSCKKSLSWFDEDGVSLLTYASFANEVSVVRTLLRRITDIKDESEQLSIVNAHIRKEGYVDLGVPGHSTALHAAMCVASPDIVAALLDAGADPFSADHMGNVPFHYAAIGGQVKNIDYWLERFPEWNLELPNTVVGGIALGLAVYVGPKKYDTVKRLLDAGASVETLTHSGGTILGAACLNTDADPAVIRLLLEHLRSMRGCSKGKNIACGVHHRACTGTRAQSVKWYLIHTLTKALYRCRLIKSGLFMSLAMDAGSTALHYAAQSGDYSLVELLLSEGSANPRIRNDLGLDAVAFSDFWGPFPPVRELLLKYTKQWERQKK